MFLRKNPSQITALIAGLAIITAPVAAEAANVVCNVHAPFGYYKVELFRTGDPYPYRQLRDVRIDGGKLIGFNNVPTGRWFVRATSQDYPDLRGQGPDTQIQGWWFWRVFLQDTWVRP
jgi:hypothetical protein